MTSYQGTIRDGCYDKIVAAKPSLVIRDFQVENTFTPTYWLEKIGDQPIVALVSLGMGTERQRELRNVAVKQLDLAVAVHLLHRVSLEDTDTIDLLLELDEQLMNQVEDDELVANQRFTWMLTEPLKDENGMIIDYEALYESGVFQAVFIAHYTYVLQ